jgi:hypothetical protein
MSGVNLRISETVKHRGEKNILKAEGNESYCGKDGSWVLGVLQ